LGFETRIVQFLKFRDVKMIQIRELINIEKHISDFKQRLSKLIKPKRFVGLAVEENAILAADVRCEKDSFLVSNTKYFVFPEGVDFKDPVGLGKALGQFLQENKFTARKAIIGIPAKWVMLREKTIPMSVKENVPAILKIHAEHEFSLSPDELALDYTAMAAGIKSNRLLLSAMLRANLDRVILAVRWAGLDVLSVTVSSIVLFALIRRKMLLSVPSYFLYIRPDYAELLARDGEQIVEIKFIQKRLKTETDMFVAELRRIMSYCQNNPDKEGGAQLLIWNASGDPCREELRALAASLPSHVKIVEGNGQPLAGKLGLPEKSDGDRFAAAVMLGQTYNYIDPFYIDFLNSRMNWKAGTIKRKQIIWASAAAVCVAILLTAVFIVWRGDNKDISELRTKLDGMKEDIDVAKDIIQKVNMAGGWYSGRPRMLECLGALTEAFPEEGKIWVTNLALSEKLKGVISGRASDEKSVIDVLDKLKVTGLFSDVQMIYLQDNGKNSQEVSFSMNFSFTGKE
jgi:hypothetical protein